MATNKPFSFAAFCTYGNACFNDPEKTPDIRDAFKTDLKKAIAHAGYPTKEEINIVDDINDFDMSATLQQVPKIVSGFIHDEQRNFDIPSSDSKTCAATVKVVAVDEKTKEGIIMLGDKKGSPYTSTIAAHEEISVKNKRDPFKK